MSKRGATSDLNHDNWDRDEDPEDSGTFEKAPQEVIKKRTIKIAKRRNPISTQNDDSKSNVFGGFTGFSKTTTSNSNDSNTNNNKTTFGFLSNLTEKSNDNEVQANGTLTNDKKSDEYYAKLKGLNESVLAWIKKHVTENPLINLQPIFKDYDRYFAELEKLKDATTITTSTTTTTSIPQLNFGSTNTSTTTAATLPKFSFGSSAPAKFSFGTSSSTAPTAASFSFGSKSSSLSSTATASFSTSSGNSPTPNELTTTTKPLIFGSTSPTTKPISSSTTIDNKTNDDNENEASDEPPKVEFTPVVEKDHIYSIRCKLFVKKDGNFGDRGVGTLYLKTIPDNEKVQLIVRADTNLGNLLCNFILSESIPVKRMGKKDVMLVCLPTPEYKPPPIPILLRVKSPEEADELLNTLEKHKK